MVDLGRLGLGARLTVAGAVLAACACQGGCVQRRMTVRSNPPGAVVYVDDYEIGTTPVSTNFTYYGTRKIRLVKNGYETLTVMQPVPVPWYQITPLDFVAENLVPGEIRDHRTFDYQLVPQLMVPTEQLLERAEGLRRQARGSGIVQAAPPMASGPIPPAAGPGAFAPGTSTPSAVAPGAGLVPSQPPSVVPQPGPAVPPSTGPGDAAGSPMPYPTAPPGGWNPAAGP